MTRPVQAIAEENLAGSFRVFFTISPGKLSSDPDRLAHFLEVDHASTLLPKTPRANQLSPRSELDTPAAWKFNHLSRISFIGRFLALTLHNDDIGSSKNHGAVGSRNP